MSSILDNFEDIISRTDTIICKSKIDKFLKTYCNACLVDDVTAIWAHNHSHVFVEWFKPGVYISKNEIANVFKTIHVSRDDDQFKYLRYHFKIYKRFRLTSNGFLKPIENRYEDCDTILIKGYPHKELPDYIKFEPYCSSKPLKIVQSNCSHCLYIPGIKSENSVSIHKEWVLKFW